MFSALDKHFVNGQVAFPGFNKVPEVLTVTLHGRKMKVRDLMKMNHREQIVVTRESDGKLLAQERHVYEKDFMASAAAFSGKLDPKESFRPPKPEEIAKYQTVGTMEQFEMVEKHRREVNGLKRAMRDFWDSVPRVEDVLPNLVNGGNKKEEEEKVVELDPVAQAKLEKKKEANRKKREKKKAKKNQATNPEDVLCEKLEKLNLSEA